MSVGRLESFSSGRNFLTSAAASPRAFSGSSREREKISRPVPGITQGRESFYREEVTSRQLVDRPAFSPKLEQVSVRSIDSRLTTPLPRPIVHQRRGGDSSGNSRAFVSSQPLSFALVSAGTSRRR